MIASPKVYPWTSGQLGETGGERPHKMKSPQTPFLTTGLARAWESLKWWGLGFQLHLQRHRRLVGCARGKVHWGSAEDSFLDIEVKQACAGVNECNGDFATVRACQMPAEGLSSIPTTRHLPSPRPATHPCWSTPTLHSQTRN